MSKGDLIRQAPSGPIVSGGVGQGFIVQQETKASAISRAFTVDDNNLFEIKLDPATSAAPYTRPELEGVRKANSFVVECLVPFETTDSWTTATVNVVTEYSLDSGVTWEATPFSTTQENSPGVSASGSQDTHQISFISEAIPGSALPNLVDGGKIMLRALFNKDAGPNGAIFFNSLPSTAPAFSLTLREQLS